MSLANPPPRRLPAKIANDPELRAFFTDMVDSLYQIWVRTGGGLGVIPDNAIGDPLASIQALSTTADQMLYTVSQGVYAATDLTPEARAFLGTATLPIEDSSAPGPIGDTTPDTGDFTDLTADTIQTTDCSVASLIVSTDVGLFGSTPVGQGGALTVSDASTIDVVYTAQEQTVLENVRTRVNELEARLDSSTGIGVFV
jgi:hypothetical protein